MRRHFKMIGFTVLFAYLALCGVVYCYQRALIYFPTTELNTESTKIINLNIDDAVVKVSTHEREGRKAVIYFGGNAETVSQSLPNYSKAFPDHALYTLHYRGFSGSTGKPTEAALHRDAEKIFERVQEKHPEITVIGRSLGSGVAVHLASRHKIERLVLVTPFDSLLNIAQARFPYLPVSLMLEDKFESWRYAPDVKAPTLILAADHDKTTPLANAKALLAAFKPGIAELKVISNTDHIDISHDPSYYPLISSNQ